MFWPMGVYRDPLSPLPSTSLSKILQEVNQANIIILESNCLKPSLVASPSITMGSTTNTVFFCLTLRRFCLCKAARVSAFRDNGQDICLPWQITSETRSYNMKYRALIPRSILNNGDFNILSMVVHAILLSIQEID